MPVEPRVAKRPIPRGDLDVDALKVVGRLVRFGHQAYLVGGCVRDLLLGCSPKDFDVATSARPPQMRKLFRNCRIIGRRFRLAHVMFRGGKIIEVATFRRDPPAVEGEGLLLTHDNVFGEPHEDALRRDFSINALFYDVAPGTIIDYVGGLADVEQRLLTTIGDPSIRFQEDPVRILRAIKFTARQDLGMDPAVYEAAIFHRELLGRSAPPRILEEVFRLLRGGAAHRSIWLAAEMGILEAVMPEVSRFLDVGTDRGRQTWRLLQAVDTMAAAGRLPADPVLLAALLWGVIVPRERGGRDLGRSVVNRLQPMSERLTIPRKLRDRLRQIIVAQRRLEDPVKAGRSKLTQRDFYGDALDLRELFLRAEGWGDRAIASWRAEISPPRTVERRPPVRRPRRRRRPRSS